MGRKKRGKEEKEAASEFCVNLPKAHKTMGCVVLRSVAMCVCVRFENTVKSKT